MRARLGETTRRRMLWLGLTIGALGGTAKALALLSRTYIAFFDWDSAVVTSRAREIMVEAARDFVRDAAVPFIHVVGASDGDDELRAFALGFQRANAIAAILRNAGIPGDKLIISSTGNQRPLVPGRGREPQNRSVILIFRRSAARAEREVGP